MRRDAPWALFTFALFALVARCDDGGGVPGNATWEVRSGATTMERATGRLLVLQLGDGVRVLRQRVLDRAPRPPRVEFQGWKGRWEVRDAGGRVLGSGRFRIPRRLHALFGDVDGPARGVDVVLERPVVWLRVVVVPGARTLVLYDDHGRRRLGEVTL